MSLKALCPKKIIYMVQEIKQKILNKIRGVLSESFKKLTEKQIDSMAEYIYRSSVVLVDEYIKKNQKQK